MYSLTICQWINEDCFLQIFDTIFYFSQSDFFKHDLLVKRNIFIIYVFYFFSMSHL